MIINKFIERAKEDEPVYISEVDKAFENLKDKSEIYIVLDLMKEGEQKAFSFFLPNDLVETEFVESYFLGKIYNIISTLGGVKLNVYYDMKNNLIDEMVKKLDDVFGIDIPRNDREGYAKAISVADRINEAHGQKSFSFAMYDIKRKPSKINSSKPQRAVSDYKKTVDSLNGLMCGIDVGGTDIKLALSNDHKILCFKEFDWNPQAYDEMGKIIDVILSLASLLQIKATVDLLEENYEILNSLEEALDKHASIDDIKKCVNLGLQVFGNRVLQFDGIGVSFPDVVVKNRIVGGEGPKFRGVRENERLDFEEEFVLMRDLSQHLREHCKKDGKVKMTNDGPMSAYTAAVESVYVSGEGRAKDGFFAHSLGTDLGTGWVDENGEIPEIPLEAYNYVIDLGSYHQKQHAQDDLRSINNFNTQIAGTVQKYASQYGAFRLAIKYFKEERMDLYQEIVDKGFVVEVDGKLCVPTEPIDYRKPFLEFLMSLPERENCETCNRIFREVGQHIAVVWSETNKILEPKAKERILFGRLVKNKRCFELMQEGAKEINAELELVAADENIANTPLMKQLKDDKNYTVAQFAQAIGAIYFAMGDRIEI